MANIKSAIKRAKQAEVARVGNLKVKRKIKGVIKNFNNSLTSKDIDSNKLLAQAFSIFDKASKRNIIHDNKAARLKSRLQKKLATKN